MTIFLKSTERLCRREFDLSIKEARPDGTFTGYASVFDVLDSYKERVAPGAFTKSLAKLKAANRSLPMLWQHDTSEPIGVFPNVREDEKGLYVEGMLILEVARAKEANALIKAGALSGLSIGFRVSPGGTKQSQDGKILTEVDLVETSLVTVPANDEARILRAETIETRRDFEKLLRSSGYSRSQAVSLAERGWGGLSAISASYPQLSNLADSLLADALALKGK